MVQCGLRILVHALIELPRGAAPLNVVRFSATTLWHFDAAEWAPSTASTADVAGGAHYLGAFVEDA
jgi:hypothetical protein